EINQLIPELIEQQKMQAEERTINLEVDLSEEELLIYGHQDSFKEIFQNLLSNALRYTKENGIIKIVTRDLGDKIELSIKDSGIGIVKDDIPKIFDEFFRSERAKREVKFGTGLGLSIVKQIVENYGGKITVQSTQGEGTRFAIIFPKQKNKNIDITKGLE
ncbi:MAG: ATP-binding protein, partial [Calditrichia bacterium]|nr:ATP-binding protein [Calditrichia bacterium]